jgi:uncharacterized protein YjbI with pentapeptide repeats
MNKDYSNQNLRGIKREGADFRDIDIRGTNFTKANLTGANFSHVDIRGTNFTEANLTGANFSHAICGLQKRSTTLLISFIVLLSGTSGFLSNFLGFVISFVYQDQGSTNVKIGSWTALIIAISLITIIIRKGLNLAFVVATAIAIIIAVILAGFRTIGVVFLSKYISPIFEITNFVAQDTVVSISIAFVITIVLPTAVLITLILSTSSNTYANFPNIGPKPNKIVTISIGFQGIGEGIASRAFFIIVPIIFSASIAGSFIVSRSPYSFNILLDFVIAIIGSLLSVSIGFKAYKGDEKYSLIRNVAIVCASFKSTSFYNANVTDANFRESTLKSADFREANLIRTCFYDTKELDFIRPGSTYLKSSQLRELLSKRKGMNQEFNGQNLQGVNLKGANLQGANFIDTDFYQANLEGANLKGAILVRTNFERANLSKANLTGSCIQDWIITKSSKLDEIICDYVFLKWVNGDKRDQMPPRDNFKKGAFCLFVNYILETIDIYHNRDINPRLALTVLKKMSKDYDEPLDVVAVGKRGDQVFLKVNLSESIDSQQFTEDYYSTYNSGLELISSSNKLLPSVNELIENRLLEIVSKSNDDNPSINVIHYTIRDIINNGGSVVLGNQTITHVGDTSMTNYDQKGANIQFVHEAKSGSNVTLNQNNYGSQQKENLAEAAAAIQELLKQLEKDNPSATEGEQISHIKDNTTPKFQRRTASALKAGGETAIDEFILDNKYLKVIKATIKGWIQPDS